MIRLRLEGARCAIALRTRARALPFLAGLGCAALLLAAEASLVGIVSSFHAPRVGRWLLSLDANDPQLQYQLGQAYLDIDPTQSLRNLRRATQLSPLNRLYWEDLESACESNGDLECSDQARERLVELCPMVPSYRWLAAQSCLRTNRLDDALKHLRRLLQIYPTYAAETWSSLPSGLAPELVFERVLTGSDNVQTKVGYADFLSENGDDNAAYRIWRRSVADSRPFPFASAQPYLDRLISRGRIEEAVTVWKDLERLGIIKSRQVAGTSDFEVHSSAQGPASQSLSTDKVNLVFNGDFDQTPLDAGFDWKTGATTYLAVDFSAPEAYRGAHCLRVDFTVRRNEEYEPIYQIVPVLPRHTYVLKAFVRSDGITSDTGPCLRVCDTQPGGFPDAVSETTTGTTPWHEVTLSFATGPQTRAVRLSLWRPRTDVFPPQIYGAFWLDAVSIEEGVKKSP